MYSLREVGAGRDAQTEQQAPSQLLFVHGRDCKSASYSLERREHFKYEVAVTRTYLKKSILLLAVLQTARYAVAVIVVCSIRSSSYCGLQ
jgi:hypothetical protein